MPSIRTLIGYRIQAVKSTELEETDGEPGMVDVWTIILTDGQTRDQIRVAMRRDTRDELVRQLTGGVVLAGGDFPRLP